MKSVTKYSVINMLPELNLDIENGIKCLMSRS